MYIGLRGREGENLCRMYCSGRSAVLYRMIQITIADHPARGGGQSIFAAFTQKLLGLTDNSILGDGRSTQNYNGQILVSVSGTVDRWGQTRTV